jgi:3-oxoacyl-[acyl-carrier protein] reductase
MNLQIAGRSALVSGASSGIGAGIAKALAREGVRVAVTARRMDRLVQLANDMEAATGARPFTVAGDITDVQDLDRIVQETTIAIGPVDILVNSAGGSRPVADGAGDDAWDEAFALNFTAARRLSQRVLPAMRSRAWGRIVNISGSMEPRSVNAASSAKAALHVWAKGLACEVAADGVTINTIPPGRINSEQILQKLHPTEASRRAFIDRNIPIGYFGEPEDIAALVTFLASPLARYITGAVIPVDGGMHYFAH